MVADPQGNGSTAEANRIQVGATGNQLTLTGPSWSLRWAPPEVVNGATTSLSGDIWSAGWVCWEVGWLENHELLVSSLNIIAEWLARS